MTLDQYDQIWPDFDTLVKCHVFGPFSRAYLVFGTFYTYFGKFSFLLMAKYLKNNLAI